jgi:catechol 2,3-dioxygenase-like lactoylglutathione lyase family enzyme
MKILDSYPFVVTDEFAACRDFYVRWFGFAVAFEADWMVLMQGGGDPPGTTIAFMHSDHPSTPPAPASHRGDGMFLTFQVGDAAAEYERLTREGLACDLPLTEEPWGQRRFGVVDPAGMWLDVVEQIEPAAGWWDPYLRSG